MAPSAYTHGHTVLTSIRSLAQSQQQQPKEDTVENMWSACLLLLGLQRISRLGFMSQHVCFLFVFFLNFVLFLMRKVRQMSFYCQCTWSKISGKSSFFFLRVDLFFESRPRKGSATQVKTRFLGRAGRDVQLLTSFHFSLWLILIWGTCTLCTEVGEYSDTCPDVKVEPPCCKHT